MHDERRVIDLRPALGEAGHEVHDMGWDDVPDTAPVLHEDPENGLDFQESLDAALSLGTLD